MLSELVVPIIGFISAVLGLVTAYVSRTRLVIHRLEDQIPGMGIGGFDQITLREPSTTSRAVRFAGRNIIRLLGFMLFGAGGGALGWALVTSPPRSTPASLGFSVGIGSTLVGAISFAIAGAIGIVVLGELVGEVQVSSDKQGSGKSVIVKIFDTAVEAIGGASWGSALGMLTGATGGIFVALTGFEFDGLLGAIETGAAGGTILGVMLSAAAEVFCRKM